MHSPFWSDPGNGSLTHFQREPKFTKESFINSIPVSHDLILSKPDQEDAKDMWALVRETPIMDLNSAYAYLLLCRDFAETCMVARERGKLAGMVTGFIPPPRPENLFIWQAVVHESFRGKGLAGQMLDELIGRLSARIRFIETTVSPSNKASRRMFEKLAERNQTKIKDREGFSESMFPGGHHEAEPCLIVGPFHASK